MVDIPQQQSAQYSQSSPQAQQRPQLTPAQQEYYRQYYERLRQQQAMQQQQMQQGQYAQPSQEQVAVQPPQSSGGHGALIFMALFLVILFSGLGGYMLLGSNSDKSIQDVSMTEIKPVVEKPQSMSVPVSTPAQPEFTIYRLQFANMINDDMTYVPNLQNTFSVNKRVYLYIEPKYYGVSASANGYSMDIVEDLQVTDPDGYDVGYMSTKNLVHMTEASAKDVAMRNWMDFASDSKLGKYTATVTLTDGMSGKSTSKSESFTLTA